MPTGEVRYVDMGNGFLNLQRWRKDFDPFKESIKSIIVWIRLLGLPLELWGESILTKLLKQIGKCDKN